MITKLKANEVFVFGSNEGGFHGAGAAKQAKEQFHAQVGVGFGLTGRCFAIPTKDGYIRTLSLPVINKYVELFLDFAHRHPDLTFLLTPIGCGLAGYSPKDIAPMFDRTLPSNVVLPKEFTDIHGDIIRGRMNV